MLVLLVLLLVTGCPYLSVLRAYRGCLLLKCGCASLLWFFSPSFSPRDLLSELANR